jgi:hypothetical protein
MMVKLKQTTLKKNKSTQARLQIEQVSNDHRSPNKKIKIILTTLAVKRHRIERDIKGTKMEPQPC